MTQVAFELDLSSGKVRDVRDVAEPGPLRDAFTWSVTCADDRVRVYALGRRGIELVGRATLDAAGVAISKVEWGDPAAPPLLFAHGGFDFAETLNVFAPLLVAHGWRVVSWDHRGHGHSAWADLYSWEADLRDAATELESVKLTANGRDLQLNRAANGTW